MRHHKVETFLSRVGWLIVVCAALSLSAYSLYWVGVHYGLPRPLAAIISLAFDGAALVASNLALKTARTHGDSGLAPRLVVIILAGVSAYLNVQHAILTGDPYAARFLYALPPITAVVIIELHARYERRGALRRAGRVSESLPVMGRWAYVLFPVKSFRVLRSIISYRLETTESQLTGNSQRALTSYETSETRTQVTTTVVRTWAKTRGIEVSDRGPVRAEVRAQYLAELTGSSPVQTVSETSLTRPNVPEQVPAQIEPGPAGMPGVSPDSFTVQGELMPLDGNPEQAPG